MIEYLIPGPNCDHPKVLQAIQKVNEKMNSEEFHAQLQEFGTDFLYANLDGLELSILIRESRLQMTVNLYTSANPWTSSNGYFSPSKPQDIFLNRRKLGRSLGAIGATTGHEWVHGEDDIQTYLEFGHGDNYWTPAKEDCAPFFVDNLLEALIDGKDISESNTADNVNIKTYIWWKPWTWL